MKKSKEVFFSLHKYFVPQRNNFALEKHIRLLFAILILLGIYLPNIANAQMTWTQVTSSANWARRCEQTCVVFDNKIWIMGGYDGTYRRNDVYNSTDGLNWTCLTTNAQWAARNAFSSVVFDNKIWIFGGCIGTTFTNDAWYSTDGINWTCANDSASWSPRACFSSLIYDNKIWIFGGMDPNGYNKNDVWCSSDGVNWLCATSNAGWSARSDYSAVVFDNKMWILGGSNISDVWYSTDGVNWIQATASALWTHRIAHTSVIYNNKMWILGGCDGEHSYRSDVWYSANGVNWICDDDTAQWCGRWLHSSVVYNNKIWVMAGLVYCVPDSSTLLNDVWYSANLGIEENSPTLNTDYRSLEIFPNPASSFFIIRSPLNAQGFMLRIFDVTGKLVKSEELKGRNNRISLDGIKNGVYFVRVGNKMVTKKLVITK
jgi:hypothetical protein